MFEPSQPEDGSPRRDRDGVQRDLVAALRDPDRAAAAVSVRALRRDLERSLTAAWPGPPGATCLAIADFADRVVGAWGAVGDGEDDPIALLAIGGYGRRELSFRSDLDLAVVIPEGAQAAAQERMERLVPLLWDAGFAVGHGAVPLSGLDRILDDELELTTGLLDARLVAGSAQAAAAVSARLDALLRDRGIEFLRRKLDELDGLHRKGGDHPSLTQPELMRGAGGLRDLQLLWLADRVAAASGALDSPWTSALEEARGRHLDLRAAMHAAAGRKDDRLGYDLMLDVVPMLPGGRGAEGLALTRAVEARLRQHIRDRRLIDRAVRWLREQVAPARTGDAAVGDAAMGDAIEARITLADLGQRVLALVSDGTGVSESILTELRERVEPAADPRSGAPGWALAEVELPAAARAPFVALLTQPEPVAAAVAGLARHDLLPRWIPGLARLDAWFQLDPYHTFTVDAHLLEALAEVERFGDRARDPRAIEDARRAELYAALAPDERLALRLAALLHDLGKGSEGRDHVREGIRLATAAARYLGLELDVAATLRFLVREHMLLGWAADRLDLRDPQVLGELALRLSSRPRLRLLYLLSIADARAVGPEGLPRWRDALLTSVFERLDAVLVAGQVPPPRTARALRDAVLAATPSIEVVALDEHLARSTSRYRGEVEPAACARHVELVRELRERGVVATRTAADGPSIGRLELAAPDAVGLFAAVTGVVAASGFPILSAEAWTRTDSVALERITLGLTSPDPTSIAADWRDLERNVRAVLGGEVSIERLISRAAARVGAGSAAIPALSVPTQVRVSNRVSAHATACTVETTDRVGLLHALLRALSELGLDVHDAKVSTRGDRAIDTFYLTEGGEKLAPGAAVDRVVAALCDAAGG